MKRVCASVNCGRSLVWLGVLVGMVALAGTASAATESYPFPSLSPWVHDLIRMDHGLAPQLDWSAPNAPDAQALRESSLRRPEYEVEALVETEHFIIHYNANDADQVAMVEGMDVIAEYVWQGETAPRVAGGLGWTAPAVDEGHGGDDRYDIYIDDLFPGLYGVTYADTVAGDYQYSAYTVIGDWMNLGQTQVTVAHEFSHACQYNWDALEDVWWFESPAIWMEDIMYTDVNDYLMFVADSWRHPEMPLDNSSMAYPHGVFVRWMSEQFDNDIVRKIWARAAETSAPRSIRSCRDVINEQGATLDWTGTIHGYHKALVDTSRFSEGDSYDYRLGTSATVSEYPGTVTGTVDYTAANIIDLDVLSRNNGLVTVSLEGEGLVATLMLGNEDGFADFPLTATEDTPSVFSVSTDGFGANYDLGYVVITNPAITGSIAYTLTANVEGWEDGCQPQRQMPFTQSWAFPAFAMFGLFISARSIRRRK